MGNELLQSDLRTMTIQRMMRSAKLIMAASVLCCTGCAAVQDAHYNSVNRSRARWAWWNDPDIEGSRLLPSDFGAGYREGWYDVASGKDGRPPAVAPRWYWMPWYQTPSGAQSIQQWYSGYYAGAMQAERGGVREFNNIPSHGTGAHALGGVPGYANSSQIDEATIKPGPTPYVVPPETVAPPNKPPEPTSMNGSHPLRQLSSQSDRSEAAISPTIEPANVEPAKVVGTRASLSQSSSTEIQTVAPATTNTKVAPAKTIRTAPQVQPALPSAPIVAQPSPVSVPAAKPELRETISAPRSDSPANDEPRYYSPKKPVMRSVPNTPSKNQSEAPSPGFSALDNEPAAVEVHKVATVPAIVAPSVAVPAISIVSEAPATPTPPVKIAMTPVVSGAQTQAAPATPAKLVATEKTSSKSASPEVVTNLLNAPLPNSVARQKVDAPRTNSNSTNESTKPQLVPTLKPAVLVRSAPLPKPEVLYGSMDISEPPSCRAASRSTSIVR